MQLEGLLDFYLPPRLLQDQVKGSEMGGDCYINGNVQEFGRETVRKTPLGKIGGRNNNNMNMNLKGTE